MGFLSWYFFGAGHAPGPDDIKKTEDESERKTEQHDYLLW
jgi:hypothetical protein